LGGLTTEGAAGTSTARRGACVPGLRGVRIRKNLGGLFQAHIAQ
jgi:hypothetical protein